MGWPTSLTSTSYGALLASKNVPSGLQRKAEMPVSACPIESWCTSLVPS